MDERAAGLVEQLVETLEGLGRIGCLEVDDCAVLARRRDLRLARRAVHDDERIQPLLCGAPGDRLRVVAGRDRDHAPLLLLGGQRRELREHAARLERTRPLQELGLEERLRRESPARERRCAMESTGDDLGRALDVVAADGQGLDRHQVTVYSGPEPPSGGVSRPPLAVIAPHCTQFEGVTCTETIPSPRSRPTS